MKTGFNDDPSQRSKPFDSRLRSQLSIFFMFFIGAGLIWLVIKLSKDFTSTVTYRVDYHNVPVGQILVKASDSSVTVGLDASGFDLVNYHFLKKIPVVNIDLSGIRLKPSGNGFTGYILTSGLTRHLAAQVGSHNELLFILPDTLSFEFLLEHRKKVPVNHLLQYNLRPQYMLYNSINVYPDSIWVYGPHELIDTFSMVSTVFRHFPDLHQDQNVKLSLQKTANLPLTYSVNEVDVSLRIEKFTEIAFDLPITIICPDSDFAVRIFPETVTVHGQVALKDYRRIDPAMLEASVLCRSGEIQASNKLRIEITEYPSYVRITRIEPERVEYILIKTAQ